MWKRDHLLVSYVWGCQPTSYLSIRNRWPPDEFLMFIERRGGGVEVGVEEVEIQEGVDAARRCSLVVCGGNHTNQQYHYHYSMLPPILSIFC